MSLDMQSRLQRKFEFFTYTLSVTRIYQQARPSVAQGVTFAVGWCCGVEHMNHVLILENVHRH